MALFNDSFCSSNSFNFALIAWSFAVKEYGWANIKPPKSLAGNVPIA